MGKYKEGLVSVIIPTYKRSDMLRKAIDTTLAQTYKNLELLVVNDNIPGDDYSKELYKLIDSYTDDRLKLIEQKKHINGAAARNAGIKVASGEFIAFQDDDDYWDENKIDLQVKELKKLDKTWGAVSCLARFYSDGQLRRVSVPYNDGNILFDILSLKTDLGTGTVLIRREALDKSGYFDEALSRHQDLQLFAFLASKYKIKLLKRYLHNREVKDNQNRPDATKLDDIKKQYFISIKPLLVKLSKTDRKIINIMHRFDTANSFRKSNNYREFIIRTLPIVLYPKTIKIVYSKLYGRLLGRIKINSNY